MRHKNNILKNIDLKKYLKTKLLRTFGIYTTANLINALIPFLLLPLLTRYLSPSDYGIVSIFQVLLNVTLPFAGLNVVGAINRYYFEKKIKFNLFVGNSFLILSLSSVILLILFLSFKDFILKLAFADAASEVEYYWLLMIVIAAFLQNLAQFILTIWQLKYKAKLYGTFRITRTLLDVGLSITLIIILKYTWDGRVFGQFAAIFLFGFIAMFILLKKKYLKISYNKEYTKFALLFGIPLIPHNLSGVIMSFSDRLFITNLVDISATGLYSVGYQVGMVVGLLQSSFNQAWVPWLFEQLKKNDKNLKYNIVKLTYVFSIILFTFAILWGLLAPFLFDFLLGKDYYAAKKFVFWIAVGYSFKGMYMMFVNYLFFIKKTMKIAQITLISAGTNIILNFILIKNYGTIGAAIATAISLFISFVLAWILAARNYKMPWFSKIK